MTAPHSCIPRLDPGAAVDAILREYPATIAVFNRFGVDACCGGARTLREAAGDAGADCCTLRAALEWAAASDVVVRAPDELHGMRAPDAELLLPATITPRPGAR